MKIIALLLITLSLFGNETRQLFQFDENISKKSMQNWLDGDISFEPYKTNYLLPYGIANKKYSSRIPNVEYANIEAEIQVSLKLQVHYDVLGLNEKYYVSYTHQAFWQIYINSSPFRDSVYNPEGFVIFPIANQFSLFGLNSFKFALAHRSNGKPDTKEIVFNNETKLGNLSKSINYFYWTLSFKNETLITDVTVWARIPESAKTDDNPDMIDYTGYSSIKFRYFFNRNMITFMSRGNLKTKKGAIELTYSHPLIHNNLFIKVFSGYVESLYTYKQNVSKFSIGFSFSN